MDPVLARRLEADKEFSGKITKLVKDYATHGFNAVANWSGEFDVAMDMINCYAPMTSKDFSALEKGHPKRFVLPMTATQITTMTTFVAQMLFGSDQPHKVEGRGPEDEMAAEHLNTLLKWNAEQQPMYLTGYLWVQDALTFNRGGHVQFVETHHPARSGDGSTRRPRRDRRDGPAREVLDEPGTEYCGWRVRGC